MLVAANLTVQFGKKPLFENVNAKFGNGNCYGLIGANGAGKSTLMKVLSGELSPQQGSVSLAPGERAGVLKQDQFAYEDIRVIDTVMMGHQSLWDIYQERNRIYSLEEVTDEEGLKVAELEEQFAELDGYSAESRVGELLMGLDIDESMHCGLMSAIPPALKLRVLLAQVLFAEPDVLLLDEPTNNLDINTIRWLETTLKANNATMVIISHDRHFLNSVCTHIADLDYNDVKVYPGNYDNYMMASLEAKQRRLADNEKKTAQIEQLQAFVRRFSANASKARQATSRAKQIEKIKLDEVKPSSRRSPYMKFELVKPLHKQALSVKKLNKSYGDLTVLNNVRLLIGAKEKVAIIGATGIGKTTLMRCLVGDLKTDNEDALISFSPQAQVGYYAQDHSATFKSDQSLLDYLTEFKKPEDDEQVVRGALGRMLFSGDDTKKPLNALSGGEQARLLFAKFTLEKPNVLLLDEPTNHLDMESIEALNLALERYEGAVVFISHDREFISTIANRIIELKIGGIEDYHGSYEEYLEKFEQDN